MSRVAKAPILMPANVELSVVDCTVTVKGPKGTLNQIINNAVDVTKNDEHKTTVVNPKKDTPKHWAHAGTVRALLNNMVKGVTEGFSVQLELVGVGYRAQVKGSTVSLSLGYSHNIEHALPEGVTAEAPNNTTLVIKGIDKQQINQVAAEIRAYRPPEPYKGKGVRYANEVIIRKEAKKK